MMPEEENRWGSRSVFIMVLICHLIGITNINSIPNNALAQGTTGYTIFLILIHIFMGIPIIYMECVVGQFTSRDCIEVWKIRPCLSFIGYIFPIWQIVILIYNHIVTSFLVHYLLISFENPIPFYTCGSWSTKYCNSLAKNYTVNQDCIKYQNLFPYCDNLFKTFPEYEYWRTFLINARSFTIAWRVCVASGLICFILFMSCFKRTKSLRWAAIILIIYSVLSVMVIFTGSMRQKGVVNKFEETLDLDFSIFFSNFRLSLLIQQIIFNLNIGSGAIFTIGSTLPFRSPCFSDIVVAVVISTIFTVIFIFSTAMMACPYAYEYGIKPGAIINTPMSLTFEKIPRLIYKYQYKTFYLIVIFSCQAFLGLSTMVMFLFNLLEVAYHRYPKLGKYPGLTALCAVFLLFLTTIPCFSYYGVNVLAFSIRRYLTLLSTFIALLECLVFLIWYGINKFSEDVHFMLGIQPKNFMKTAWILSICLLAYAFNNELYSQITHGTSHLYATCFIIAILGFIAVLFVMRLFIAVCRKRFHKLVSLDPTWGPNSDILQRSRGMFSAQAMTKEYIYRQYHLQAGIIDRKKRANKRI